MLNTRKKLLCLGVLLSIQVSTIADDTDIYVNATPQIGAEPMVFLTLDYRPNLGSALCTEVSPKDPDSACGILLGDAYPDLTTGPGQVTLFEGIRAVFTTLFNELDNVKVAFMINHDDTCTGADSSGGPLVSGCSNGAYFLQGLQKFEENDTNGAKASMLAALNAMPIPQGAQSHAYQGKELYFELFRYLTGQAWHNAHLGWEDFNTDASENLDTDNPALVWDSSIESGASYITPFTDPSELECTQAFAVNLMFQVSNQDGGADSKLKGSIASGGMEIGVNNPDFDDVISHMFNTDMAPLPANGTWPEVEGNQNLQSYFIVDQVNNTTNGYAANGGTISALALSTPSILLDDLRAIFQEILTVSTTMVAASVPVNVFNRSAIADSIFMAQFTVDGNARPNWDGNLKKLRLRETTDAMGSQTLSLVDVNDAAAIATDGRFKFGALSYWTDAGSLPTPVGSEVAGRDGRSIARGGAAQMIPGYLDGSKSIGDSNTFNTRTVYTVANSGSALMDLEVSSASILEDDLGAGSQAEAEELIRWLRGQDVDDEDLDSDVTEARRWIMGAPLHSRPLPINYGARTVGYSESNPDIRIFMATDDGFMHSIRNTDSSGNESGVEDWAFMPREVMDKMSILRANSPLEEHPYTLDGAPSAYIVDTDQDGTIGKDANGDADSSDKVYLFFGQRRGGKSYYALDITNPDSPELAWTLSNTGDFSELGMTFSGPRVGTVKFGSSPTPVIIFGGGYDEDKDSGAADDDEGNAIFIVNAETGALVWKATYGGSTGSQSSTLYHHSGMVDSIPSDMAALDTNGDGNLDRLYVGDTGGTVWRVDLLEGSTDIRSSWFVSELANLGGDDTPGGAVNDRRFFHRPDFVPSSDQIGAFDGIVIGSGDRSDPRGDDVANWLYMLKDRNIVTGTVATSPFNHANYNAGSNTSGLGETTDSCITDSSCISDEQLSNGWKMELQEPGEKVLAPAITAFGTIFFTSFLPEGSGADAGSPCAPSEGGGRLYAINLANAAPANNFDTTGSSAEIMTKSDRYKALSSGGIPAEVVPIGDYILPPDLNPQSTGGRSFWKTFWYEKNVDSF